MKKNHSKENAFIKEKEARFNKLQTFFLIIITVLVLTSFIKNINTLTVSKKRLDDAQKKVASIKDQNKELRENLENIHNSYYQEKQLRDKLGMSKEGEIILVMPSDEVIKSFAPKKPEVEIVQLIPNWKKWANLFI